MDSSEGRLVYEFGQVQKDFSAWPNALRAIARFYAPDVGAFAESRLIADSRHQ